MAPGDGPKSLSQQRFGQLAGHYVTSQTHAKGAELDRLIEIARPKPGWLALDVATGGGHTALKFVPQVARMVATDITLRMLDKARDFIINQGIENVAFGVADAENLPFRSGTFDLVTCRIAPHHFPNCARFVREGSRVLNPSGLLLIQDHVLPEDQETASCINVFEKLRDPSHNRAFSHSEWMTMFREAGLQVENTELIVKQHPFLPWAERQGCSPEVIARLVAMIEQASPKVLAWMQPREFDSAQASFVNRHLIIAGRKT